MAPYSLGLFMDPPGQAFGWSRALISSSLTLIAGFGILLTPVVGALSDRYGPRSIALPGIVLASIGFAALALNGGSVPLWIILWSLYAIVFVAVKPLVWSAAVSRAFDRSRGLALAVTLSGVAISQTMTPILAEWLIRTQGWRPAFAWLGFGWGGVVLVIVVLFIHELPGAAVPAAAGRRDAIPARRTLRAILDRNIVRIAVSSLLLAAVGAGIAVHKVPILGEFGIDRGMDARLAATAGVSGIAGKIAMGWLMDRFDGHVTGAVGTAITGLGVAMLLPPAHPFALIVAAMLVLGFGAGAGLQVSVYLVSRFADAGSFGRAFGAVSAMTAVGAGLGPSLFGTAYATFRDYDFALVAAVPVCIVCGVLIATLDPLAQKGS